MPNTTTPGALRDYMIGLVAAMTSSINSKDRFVQHHNEKDGDFLEWCKAHPQAAFRRFQIRDNGDRRSPACTNSDVEECFVTYEILVAYPQTSRTGKDNALDRDDAMEADRKLLVKTIGLSGYANFQGANPNAAWVEGSATRQETNFGFDLLVMKQTMRIYVTVP
jgi:hypothetical protein